MKIALIVDIALVGIVIVSTILGRISGMVKTLKGLVAPVLAVVLAISLNSVITPVVERMPFFPTIETKVSSIIDDKMPDMPENSEGAAELTEEEKQQLCDIFEQFGMDSQSALDAVLRGEGGNQKEALNRMVSHAIARAIAYVAVFVVARILLAILFAILGVIFKSDALKGVNHSLGTVIGALRGVVFLLILSFLLQKAANMFYAAWPKLSEIVADSYLVPFLAKWAQWII